MKRRVLCFGDSNTWGYSPAGTRFDESTRWPMRLQAALGGDYTVIEEGLNGRTTVHDDPTEGGHKSALRYLPGCLMSHAPLDLVVLMLGTNDTKQRFGMNAYTISQGMSRLIQQVRLYGALPGGKPPRVLLVAPILIGDWIMDTEMGPTFGPQSAAVARGLAEEYRKLAGLFGVEYLNAAGVAQPCAEDAVHMTAENHEKLAEALRQRIVTLFKEVPLA